MLGLKKFGRTSRPGSWYGGSLEDAGGYQPPNRIVKSTPVLRSSASKYVARREPQIALTRTRPYRSRATRPRLSTLFNLFGDFCGIRQGAHDGHFVRHCGCLNEGLGLRWLEPVALTDCSDLQMQTRVSRMAAILNQVLLRFMGSPNFNHD